MTASIYGSNRPDLRSDMADPARFGHDRLGHLLEDELLVVPNFQRKFAWDKTNVEEYLQDLGKARSKDTSYFMGTVVLAEPEDDSPRKLIVDGQQRLTTTALLLIAIRDRLREIGRDADAESVDSRFIRRYELSEQEELARLVPGPSDLNDYDDLVTGCDVSSRDSLLLDAYRLCKGHVDSIDEPGELIKLTSQLADSVQILLAVASGIPEAFVIFETLNDRGAALTTADLLKNYLFSQCTSDTLPYVEATWARVTAAFEKPEDFVKFVKHEYSSRAGRVTHRKLYRALQDDIGSGAIAVRAYLRGVESSLDVFLAIQQPDNNRWNSGYDISEALLAFRRFGFESSLPLLLAAFREWDETRARKLVKSVANWSVRATIGGRLGGGTAEDLFCRTALQIHKEQAGAAKNQIRKILLPLVPTDSEFVADLQSYNPSASRAKYILGSIERVLVESGGHATTAQPHWSGRNVSVEHIEPQSLKRSDFDSDAEFESFQSGVGRIGNLTLLERGLNSQAKNSRHATKRQIYNRSAFAMTQQLAAAEYFDATSIADRSTDFAKLAVHAWPR